MINTWEGVALRRITTGEYHVYTRLVVSYDDYQGKYLKSFSFTQITCLAGG